VDERWQRRVHHRARHLGGLLLLLLLLLLCLQK
jgi:hypothetical protein